MPVNYINLSFSNPLDKPALATLNELSIIEGRKPHDTLRRLIVEAGSLKIKELSDPSELKTPSSESLKHTPQSPQSQVKNDEEAAA